eukprot:2247670-Amphidinium_carterae.1
MTSRRQKTTPPSTSEEFFYVLILSGVGHGMRPRADSEAVRLCCFVVVLPASRTTSSASLTTISDKQHAAHKMLCPTSHAETWMGKGKWGLWGAVVFAWSTHAGECVPCARISTYTAFLHTETLTVISHVSARHAARDARQSKFPCSCMARLSLWYEGHGSATRSDVSRKGEAQRSCLRASFLFFE